MARHRRAGPVAIRGRAPTPPNCWPALTTRRRVFVAQGAVFALAMVGWSTVALVDLMANQHIDGHVSFAVPSGRVHIQLSSGSVHIVALPDRQ
jgi:hypothetical protein